MGAIKIEHLPQYKIADYQRWEGDWELIKGIPFAMSPSANTRHQRILRKILYLLQAALDDQTCQCEVLFELDLILDQDTVVRPDLMIFCDRIDHDYPTNPPALIVEIISTSSKTLDRSTKFELYQEYGVKNYLIVDPESKEINVFSLVKGKYVQTKLDVAIQLKDSEIRLDFEGIFA
jgi:Uma2 family endonuclease